MRANKDVRRKIKTSGVYQWEVAEAIGVSEVTLIRWLRTPLDEEKSSKIHDGIQKAKSKKEVD